MPYPGAIITVRSRRRDSSARENVLRRPWEPRRGSGAGRPGCAQQRGRARSTSLFYGAFQEDFLLLLFFSFLFLFAFNLFFYLFIFYLIFLILREREISVY